MNKQECKKFVFAGVFRRHGVCKNRLFALLSLFPMMSNVEEVRNAEVKKSRTS
jgi:hypothetical protein